MSRNLRNKINTLTLFTLCVCISGCDVENNYIKQGHTQEVIYDLGEGIYTANNRNTHTLSLFYKPGSYITDFSDVKGYDFYRESEEEGLTYELGGWYFDKEFTEKVDFQSYTLPEKSGETITIYAKWEEVYDKHFKVYYQDDNGQTKELTTLSWSMDKPFEYSEDLFEHPSTEDYTYIAAYTDEAMTILVDENYVLKKEDRELPIYTKWIQGKYKVINNVSEFQKYFRSYVNTYGIYLNSDLDLTGVTLPKQASLFGMNILGNNHKLMNLSYSSAASGNATRQNCVVGALAEKMENVTIKDLIIEDAIFTMQGATCSALYFALLAGEMKSCTIENVSVSGQIVYDEATANRLGENIRVKTDEVAYTMDEQTTVSGCTFNVLDTKGV